MAGKIISSSIMISSLSNVGFSGIIVAGYDDVNGGQVFSVPLGKLSYMVNLPVYKV